MEHSDPKDLRRSPLDKPSVEILLIATGSVSFLVSPNAVCSKLPTATMQQVDARVWHSQEDCAHAIRRGQRFDLVLVHAWMHVGKGGFPGRQHGCDADT